MFLKVLDVLKPTDCIFVGVESSNCFWSLTERIEKLDMIGRTYPRVAYITLPSGYELKIVFIQHSSQYFSADKWHELLKQQLPEAMQFINS